MKFIKRDLGEYNRFNMKGSRVLDTVHHMTLYMRLFHFQNLFISMNICIARRQNVTFSRRKRYVICGHNIINDMTLSTE